jgi:hypothetical protein
VKKSAVLVVVIILVGISGFLLYRQTQLQQRLDEQAAAVEEAKKPKYVHRTDVLASGEMTVVPAQPQAIRVSIDTSMRNIKITGRFTASGGTDNGIEAFVFDEDNYTNWFNGHQTQALFQSGVETVGHIQANIGSPGIYYVVFSGRRNFLTRKVDTDLKLDYERLTNPTG